MSITEYLKAIVRGWWMVLIGVILGAGGAVAIIATTAPTYAGTVTFFVNTTQDVGVNPLQGDQYAQQRVATYARLVSSDRLATLIAADTRINESPSDIAASISGESPLNTVLLTATVQGSSRPDVSAVTHSLSTQFVKMIRTIDPTVSLEVTSGPTVLPTPIAPRKTLDLGVGILIGLVVGAGAAVIRQTLDATVRSAASLSAATGTPVLGWIAKDSVARKGSILIHATSTSARTESFRKLRTNLQFLDGTGRGTVIVVTSSVYGEGKTATAANLAIVYTEAGRKTLLVDGDLRRPRIAEYLKLDQSPGLSEVLTGTAARADALQHWHGRGMTVLTSGALPPNPAELLGSRSMAEMLDEFRADFDIIIVDTPPLLPVTDAAVAAGQSDGALVMVRHGRTKLAQASSAISALEAADARVLGCVVNFAPPTRARAPRERGADENEAATGAPIDGLPTQLATDGRPTDRRPARVLDDEVST